MKRYWPEFILGIGELLLLYVGLFTEYLQLPAPYSKFLSVLLLQFGLVILYIPMRLNYTASKNANELTRIGDTILSGLKSTAEIRVLRQNDFYREFHSTVRSARAAVSMAHLDRDAPPSAALTETGRYYRDLPDLIRQAPAVVFKRVERLSQGKWGWIERLLAECEGLENFNLSLLEAPVGSVRIPHVSVQVIDDDLTYLVAIAEHEDLHDERDICIRSDRAAAMWRRYYEENLWLPAIVVMREGRRLDDAIERARGILDQ